MSIEYTNAPTLIKVGKEFTRHFRVPFKNFFDNELSLITKEIKVDMFKFDDYLYDTHPEYEEQELTMDEIVTKKYGEDANTFIKQLI